jgi:RNA polymerase sigma-70 factor (ECF subfamily)
VQTERLAGEKIAGVSAIASKIRQRTAPAELDAESRRWVERLRVGHPRHEQAVGSLHSVLRRVAVHELARRRHQLLSVNGPEFDDLAQQAADDALVSVLDKLEEFRGLSRFTTWAYKFVMFEVSTKVARHAWRRQSPEAEPLAWDQLPDRLACDPEHRLEQRAQLDALTRAIEVLTDRQREVFVAIALNDVPIDALALKLRTNRNAIYKNLFDARRHLRTTMAAAGHPVNGASGREIAASGNGRRAARASCSAP